MGDPQVTMGFNTKSWTVMTWTIPRYPWDWKPHMNVIYSWYWSSNGLVMPFQQSRARKPPLHVEWIWWYPGAWWAIAWHSTNSASPYMVNWDPIGWKISNRLLWHNKCFLAWWTSQKIIGRWGSNGIWKESWNLHQMYSNVNKKTKCERVLRSTMSQADGAMSVVLRIETKHRWAIPQTHLRNQFPEKRPRDNPK